MEVWKVKEGQTGSAQTEAFRRVARDLAPCVNLVLVACTELSMLPLPENAGFQVLDTLDLLADAAIAQARGG